MTPVWNLRVMVDEDGGFLVVLHRSHAVAPTRNDRRAASEIQRPVRVDGLNGFFVIVVPTEILRPTRVTTLTAEVVD
jgi:hypothetical protein